MAGRPAARSHALLLRARPQRRGVPLPGATVRTVLVGSGAMDGSRRTIPEGGAARSALDAAFLVDATGRPGFTLLARRLGARVTYLDRLVGLAVLFTSPRATDGLTLVEACEEGWWYSFAVTGPRRLVVLMSDSDLAENPPARPCRTGGLRSAFSWGRALAPASMRASLGPPRLPSRHHRPGWLGALPSPAGSRWAIRLATACPASPRRAWSSNTDPRS